MERLSVTAKDLEASWEKARELFESFETNVSRETERTKFLEDGTEIKVKTLYGGIDTMYVFVINNYDKRKLIEFSVDKDGLNFLRVFQISVGLGNLSLHDANISIEASKRPNLRRYSPELTGWVDGLIQQNKYAPLPLTVSVEGEM